MTTLADCSRRPRRFFGWHGVVRQLRLRRLPAGDEARARRPSPTDADRALQTERARFAANVDRELRLACRNEATMRRELGAAARAFIRGRAHRRLGFVRLSDYARERLGVSARTLQSAAWLATRLDELPAVSTAYDRAELSWAQARAICTVAVAADEEQWLALARRSTVDRLERLVARARHPDAAPSNSNEDANIIDGEPAVRWRFVCPARVRALWRRARELASRAAGEPLSDWRAAEIIAAEGSSGRPAGTSMGDRALLEALLHARQRRPETAGRDVAARDERSVVDAPGETTFGPPPSARSTSEQPRSLIRPTFALVGDVPSAAASLPADVAPAPSDPFALDARLTDAMRVLRTTEPRIGRLLSVVVDHRLYRSLGYPSFDDYVRERLGISARKAWALRKVEKATLRSADFDRAYRDGRLSWVRALSLLPVLDRSTAPAWVARAESVTVRRLCDEVDWVLASRDALGPDASLAPPPVDSRLSSPIQVTPLSVTAPGECRDLSPHARLQIRAHGERVALRSMDERQKALEVCDAEIRFTGPASVVALLRDVLDSFADPAHPGEPRWTALERLLRHVITYWESTPRHHDPVFARDGWRCTVPACSSRRNLHDHHIRFRSRGGENRRDNRTAVCAAHHLHGLHGGTIHASGVAPHAIEWQLGVRPGALPFLTYVGDRLCQPDDAATAPARA